MPKQTVAWQQSCRPIAAPRRMRHIRYRYTICAGNTLSARRPHLNKQTRDFSAPDAQLNSTPSFQHRTSAPHFNTSSLAKRPPFVHCLQLSSPFAVRVTLRHSLLLDACLLNPLTQSKLPLCTSLQHDAHVCSNERPKCSRPSPSFRTHMNMGQNAIKSMDGQANATTCANCREACVHPTLAGGLPRPSRPAGMVEPS